MLTALGLFNKPQKPVRRRISKKQTENNELSEIVSEVIPKKKKNKKKAFKMCDFDYKFMQLDFKETQMRL